MIVSCLFMVGCIIISLGSIFTAKGMVDDAHKKVYVLDGNVPILVQRTTMDETLDVEAKSHVELFHHLFFTLAPDDKYINYTMEKAMYLVDETGLAQYNALKEKGFYNNIMGTSAVFSIFCDSIKFDKQQMTFTYYGRQRIERRTNILMRKLVTAGELKRVPRTENNPHGLLITNWRTLLNQDLEQKQKTIYYAMGWKRLIVGEPMPDKNDPKYKERYEREVEAGKRFADKCGISWGAKRLQEVGQEHKMAFLAIVFGFVMVCFMMNVFYLMDVMQHQGQIKATAIERVDSAMQSKGHHIVVNKVK